MTTDELIDEFIEKWCGDNAPHLLDSDENDGETLREAIRDKVSHAAANQLNDFVNSTGNALQIAKTGATMMIKTMCADTNATTAEMKLSDLELGGKAVGSWKVTLKKLPETAKSKKKRSSDGK